jgi:hypothetical protein
MNLNLNFGVFEFQQFDLVCDNKCVSFGSNDLICNKTILGRLSLGDRL